MTVRMRSAGVLRCAALVAALMACRANTADERRETRPDSASVVRRAGALAADSTVVVRVLDVGQGDATLIENGTSRILIDGGASREALGRHLDRLRLNGDTIHVVLITHAHLDHYNGLHELFETRRRITIRYLFENRDMSTNVTLAALRDSILARASRGELVYRDTDDPCGDGTPICTITMRGGARFHVLRPDPRAGDPNNRSTPARLVGPDSTRFSMWFAGDAERESIAWFDSAGYDEKPGMRAHVLKGNHHGSCNGITRRYLELVSPQVVTFSVGGTNEYGHVHDQSKRLLDSLRIPWYRTDQNGEIVITAPSAPGGSGFSVKPARGSARASGAADRRSSQEACR